MELQPAPIDLAQHRNGDEQLRDRGDLESRRGGDGGAGALVGHNLRIFETINATPENSRAAA